MNPNNNTENPSPNPDINSNNVNVGGVVQPGQTVGPQDPGVGSNQPASSDSQPVDNVQPSPQQPPVQTDQIETHTPPQAQVQPQPETTSQPSTPVSDAQAPQQVDDHTDQAPQQAQVNTGQANQSNTASIVPPDMESLQSFSSSQQLAPTDNYTFNDGMNDLLAAIRKKLGVLIGVNFGIYMGAVLLTLPLAVVGLLFVFMTPVFPFIISLITAVGVLLFSMYVYIMGRLILSGAQEVNGDSQSLPGSFWKFCISLTALLMVVIVPLLLTYEVFLSPTFNFLVDSLGWPMNLMIVIVPMLLSMLILYFVAQRYLLAPFTFLVQKDASIGSMLSQAKTFASENPQIRSYISKFTALFILSIALLYGVSYASSLLLDAGIVFLSTALGIVAAIAQLIVYIMYIGSFTVLAYKYNK